MLTRRRPSICSFTFICLIIVIDIGICVGTYVALNIHGYFIVWFDQLCLVCILMQDCDKNLLYDLVLKLKPVLFLPGDYICRKVFSFNILIAGCLSF